MIEVYADRCPQNHRCPTLSSCPSGAISQRGNAAPEIDMARCTGCGKCARLCPVFVMSRAAQRSLPNT